MQAACLKGRETRTSPAPRCSDRRSPMTAWAWGAMASGGKAIATCAIRGKTRKRARGCGVACESTGVLPSGIQWAVFKPYKIAPVKGKPPKTVEAIDVASRHLVYKLFEETNGQLGAWHVLVGMGERPATVARGLVPERGDQMNGPRRYRCSTPCRRARSDAGARARPMRPGATRDAKCPLLNLGTRS